MRITVKGILWVLVYALYLVATYLIGGLIGKKLGEALLGVM